MNSSLPENISSMEASVRKSLSVTLQAFARVGQTEIARCSGFSTSTVSRIKSERLEGVVRVLAASGLKIVPSDYVGDHKEFIDAALVFAHYGLKAIQRDQRVLNQYLLTESLKKEL